MDDPPKPPVWERKTKTVKQLEKKSYGKEIHSLLGEIAEKRSSQLFVPSQTGIIGPPRRHSSLIQSPKIDETRSEKSHSSVPQRNVGKLSNKSTNPISLTELKDKESKESFFLPDGENQEEEDRNNNSKYNIPSSQTQADLHERLFSGSPSRIDYVNLQTLGSRPHRNVSRSRLSEIMDNEGLDTYVINKTVFFSKLIAILLIASGLLLMTFVMIVSIFSVDSGYLKAYLRQSLVSMILLIGGMLHPPSVGIFGLFALKELKQVRSYVLRIPFTLVLTLGLLVWSACYLKSSGSLDVETYLADHAKRYDDDYSSDIWDKLQVSHSCCGIKGPQDWKNYQNSEPNSTLPESCCITSEDDENDDEECAEFFDTGCLPSVASANKSIATVILVISVLQMILLIMSIAIMNDFHRLIKDEVIDRRTSWKIILGKCFSICETNEFDRQQELAEQEHLELQRYIGNLPGDRSEKSKGKRTLISV